MRSNEAAATISSGSLLAGVSSFNFARSQNQIEPKPTIELGSQNGDLNSAATYALDERLSDDFFASFDETEIL